MPSSVMDPRAGRSRRRRRRVGRRGVDRVRAAALARARTARRSSSRPFRARSRDSSEGGASSTTCSEKGYAIGGFLNNDIVGADFAPGAPHRVRVFSGGGPDGVDSPSRDLARAVEEIAGRDAVRLVFRLDRLGRGGDHRPFVEAGLPAVRFTEPLENYDHEHQTPRVEDGREYGDLVKFLNFRVPRQRRARQRRDPAPARARAGRAGRA